MLELYSRFWFLRLHHHRYVILHQSTTFRPNRTIRDSYDIMSIFHHVAILGLLLVSVSWLRSFGKVEISLCTKFRRDSQSTAEILLLPVSENKRPLRWNSTAGSDFYVWITIGMWFCICLPNFVQIGLCARRSYNVISIFIRAAVRHIGNCHGNCRAPTVLKFRLDQIYNFGDIAILCCEALVGNAYLRGFIRGACTEWKANPLLG